MSIQHKENIYQNSKDIFSEIEKRMIKFLWNYKISWIAKVPLNHKELIELPHYLVLNPCNGLNVM